MLSCDMRQACAFVFALAGAGALMAQQPPARDPNTFRAGIDITGITVTVRDGDGHLVNDLSLDAFQVFDDGERQEVTQFTRERVPVSLGVLIDISDSMFGRRIADARTAVDRFTSSRSGRRRRRLSATRSTA